MLAPIEEIFCHLDDFCKQALIHMNYYLLPNPQRQRQKYCQLCLSEIMTIMVLFHLSHYRTFKDYYRDCVVAHLKPYFPQLVSYNRFVELMPSAFLPLVVYLQYHKGEETGLYYVDSTDLPVCHNRRIFAHQTFKGIAERGKTSVDFFFGFKLHLVINQLGQLMSFCLTPGNVDDRKPLAWLFKGLTGTGAGDRGYISKEKAAALAEHDLNFITRVKRNMKPKLFSAFEKTVLGQRGLVELVISQLKSFCQIDHTRHRSPFNFLVNVLSGLVAYVLKPRKPYARFKNLPSNLMMLMPN